MMEANAIIEADSPWMSELKEIDKYLNFVKLLTPIFLNKK